LDAYKPAEELSDRVRHDFDNTAIVENLGPKLNAFIHSTKA